VKFWYTTLVFDSRTYRNAVLLCVNVRVCIYTYEDLVFDSRTYRNAVLLCVNATVRECEMYTREVSAMEMSTRACMVVVC
jgi:hypothetical protein